MQRSAKLIFLGCVKLPRTCGRGSRNLGGKYSPSLYRVSALSEFAFSLQLARIGPDGGREREREAQHELLLLLQGNPFIALMSVKMPDGR